MPEYAKSSLYVARHQLTAVDGDLDLACEYLERVATSNSEEVGLATELLKKVKAMIAAKAEAAIESGTKSISAPEQIQLKVANPAVPSMTAD